MAEIKGIDISKHQGTVDWGEIQDSYKQGEIGFVILRAGYGGGQEMDDQFDRNQREARERGIPRQFYFFAYPGRGSGKSQAEAFFKWVGPLLPGESVSLDMEDEPSYGRRLVASDVGWALEFLQRSKELFGVKPLIYMNSDVLGRFNWTPVKDGDYGLWLANYGANNGQPNSRPKPGVWPFFAIWQYTSNGKAAGIQPVDMNIFTGSVESFLKYGYQGGSQPAPTPPTPAPTPTPPSPPPASNTVTIGRPIPGYVTAADAAARKNSNSTVPAGTYRIFNQAQGMINATRTAGQPGWWINPGDIGGAPAPAPQPRYYTIIGGDTNSKIARQFGTTVDQLVAWNKSKYPKMTRDYIEAGWSIRVK